MVLRPFPFALHILADLRLMMREYDARPYCERLLRSLVQNLKSSEILDHLKWSAMGGDEIGFGGFRLNLGQRKLLRAGTPVRLGSRAMDLLFVLATSKGEVVSKDELLTRVWPGLTVEENNLQVQISALRKATR